MSNEKNGGKKNLEVSMKRKKKKTVERRKTSNFVLRIFDRSRLRVQVNTQILFHPFIQSVQVKLILLFRVSTLSLSSPTFSTHLVFFSSSFFAVCLTRFCTTDNFLDPLFGRKKNWFFSFFCTYVCRIGIEMIWSSSIQVDLKKLVVRIARRLWIFGWSLRVFSTPYLP